ncbi:sigma 54-interacting transcriptional regulator [Planctomycetota bacterium]
MKEEKIVLGPEIWKRIFAAPIVQQTRILFRQIFKRSFAFDDFKAMGITREEWERIRGPLKESPIPFPFCDLIYFGTKEGKRRCERDKKQSMVRISPAGKPDIFTCHAGLTEIAIPIMFRDKYYGMLTVGCGGLLLHEPNETEWHQITERVKDIGVDLDALKKAYFEIAPISKELIDVMIQLFGVIIEEVIKAAVEAEADKKRIVELESVLYGKYKFDQIIGKSEAIQGIFKLLSKVVENDSPILIEGETGTGKELIASTIHYNSFRKDKPLNTVNCGAFAESLLESEFFGHIKGSFTGAISHKKGVFEVTNQGTLFLDEVAEMSPALQVKLLRVLQEGTFTPVGSTQTRRADVRIISATNKNLKELVAQGKFRGDLYYRLNVIKVLLPPLRNRKEDIPLLIDHFIKTNENATKKKITGVRQDVLKCLLDYSWPGNVRELQNILERVIALASPPACLAGRRAGQAGSSYITSELLPEEIIRPQKSPSDTIDITKSFEALKKDYFYRLLTETRGNITQAARQAGLNRITFQRFLKKYRFRASDFKKE